MAADGNWMRPAAAGVAVVALSFGALGSWAYYAKLDSAVAASGAIVVESDRKAVQHLEGGIVLEIYARDGDRVAEGQPLLRLDDAQARSQVAAAAAQIAGDEDQITSARRQAAIIETELANLYPLAQRGLVTANRVTTLQRQGEELVGRIGQLQGDARKMNAEIGRLEDSRRRSVVRAPRAGRVIGLKVHAPGAVAKPGETLMEIVPAEDRLVVSARMSPLDVNHVREGLPAEVRLPSFKSRTTPVAVGEVVGVAADAVRDEVTRQSSYELRVSVNAAAFPQAVRDKLKPGMPAEVFVATGERTVLTYLTQPLADAMRRGMREN